MNKVRNQAVFGGADGLTTALGLIVAMAAMPHELWRAALAAGIAGFAGMTGGAWLSGQSKLAALANGMAALAACAVPALPYLFLSRAVAIPVSLWVVVGAALLIGWLRPDADGWRGYAQTFGVLMVAATLCYIAGVV